MHFLAAEGPNGVWLPSDIKEFWWSTAAFLVVVALLTWKVLPLVKKAMADRSDGIRDELDAAAKAKVDAEAELAALKSKLGDADAESQRIISDAKSQAETVKSDLMTRADADAVDAKDKAGAEIAASKGQATADIQAAVAGQAATAAEAVVTANLDDATHADLIDRYIEQVTAS